MLNSLHHPGLVLRLSIMLSVFNLYITTRKKVVYFWNVCICSSVRRIACRQYIYGVGMELDIFFSDLSWSRSCATSTSGDPLFVHMRCFLTISLPIYTAATRLFRLSAFESWSGRYYLSQRFRKDDLNHYHKRKSNIQEVIQCENFKFYAPYQTLKTLSICRAAVIFSSPAS